MDISTLILLIVLAMFPVLYVIGEVKNKRWMRIIGVIGILPIGILLVYVFAGTAALEYNIMYGHANKKLLNGLEQALTKGEQAKIAAIIQQLNAEFDPRYSDISSYNQQIDEMLKRLANDTP